jgi:hypothetical protein
MPKQIHWIQVTLENVRANLALFRKHIELEEAVFTLSDPTSSRRAHRYQRSTPEVIFAHFEGLAQDATRRNPGYNNTYRHLLAVSDGGIYLASCIVFEIKSTRVVTATPQDPNIFEIWSVLSNPNYTRSGAVAFMLLNIYSLIPEAQRAVSKLKLVAWQQNFPFISFYDRVLLYAKYGFHNVNTPYGMTFELCWDREHEINGQQRRLDYVASLSSQDITFISKFNETNDSDSLYIILTRDLEGRVIEQNLHEIPIDFRTNRLERNDYEGEEDFKRIFKMMYYSRNDFWMTTDLLNTYNYEKIHNELQQKQNIPLRQINSQSPDHQYAFLHHSGLLLTPDRHIATFVVPADTEIVVINTPGYSTYNPIIASSWNAMIRHFSQFSIDQLQQLFSNFKANPNVLHNGINVRSLLDYLINTASGLVFQINMPPQNPTYVQIHCYKPGDHCPNYIAGSYSFRNLPSSRQDINGCNYDWMTLMFGMYRINTDPNEYRNQKWRFPNVPPGPVQDGIHPQFATRLRENVPNTPICVRYRFNENSPYQTQENLWRNSILPFGFPNPAMLVWPTTPENYADFLRQGHQLATNTFSYHIHYSDVAAMAQQQAGAGRKRMYIFSCGNIMNPDGQFNLTLNHAAQFRMYSPTLFKEINTRQYEYAINRVGEILHDIYNNYLPPVLTPASPGRTPANRNMEQNFERQLEQIRVQNPGLTQEQFVHYSNIINRVRVLFIQDVRTYFQSLLENQYQHLGPQQFQRWKASKFQELYEFLRRDVFAGLANYEIQLPAQRQANPQLTHDQLDQQQIEYLQTLWRQHLENMPIEPIVPVLELPQLPGAPAFAAVPLSRKSKSAKSKPATRKSKSAKSKPATRKSKSANSKPATRKSKSAKSKPATRKSKSA